VIAALLVAGCASLRAGGGADVILTSQPMPTGTYVIDFGSAMPRATMMDRFLHSEPVYLRIGFSNSQAHSVQVVVNGPTPVTRAWNTRERPDLIEVIWQFQIAASNTLLSGPYVIRVSIDGQPAGEYTFTVE
jgi:hypothetical protein